MLSVRHMHTYRLMMHYGMLSLKLSQTFGSQKAGVLLHTSRASAIMNKQSISSITHPCRPLLLLHHRPEPLQLCPEPVVL